MTDLIRINGELRVLGRAEALRQIIEGTTDRQQLRLLNCAWWREWFRLHPRKQERKAA